MSRRSIPSAPWHNGVYPDGDYDVVIQGIERHQYGHKGDFYFRIVLKLVQQQAHLVTNIYVKEETQQTAIMRVWHLCQACGMPDKDFYKRLSEFRGKHLRVTLKRMPPKKSGARQAFSDVKKFLKATKPLSELMPPKPPIQAPKAVQQDPVAVKRPCDLFANKNKQFFGTDGCLRNP